MLRQSTRLLLTALVPLIAGCGSMGSMSKGSMEWVQPQTVGPRAGTAYLVRGWVGIFSGGMDRLQKEISDAGVTARIYQHDQCEELAKTMAANYKAAKNPEPICMIGHSFGSDDSIIIARELDKVGVPVDLIIIMDAVNETTVPKNVKLCVNYWMPGYFGNSNFLRGIPLKQEPGSTGKLYNINLNEEGKDLKEAFSNHINIDEGAKVHKAILEHVLNTCPERGVWAARTGGGSTMKPLGLTAATPAPHDAARTAASPIGPSAAPTKSEPK